MKRMIACLLATLLVLSGCQTPAGTSDGSSAPVQSEQPAEQPPEQRSLTYLEQFERGEFAPFYQAVSDELSAQLPQEMFGAQWAMIQLQEGKQESMGEPQALEQDGNTVVTIEAVHTLRRLVSTFVYDTDGRVVGINNLFQPLITEPQSTDRWEELPVQVGAGENKLNGLLTLPKGVEKPPVAILLQGSGPSNMDEKIGAGGNKPFADLAHGLAEGGVASIRYDKRTYAYPADCVGKGIECEYLDDVAAAIALVAGNERVAGDRVFLIGHSEGGMLAPRIARDNPNVRGIVSMAGTLRCLEDVVLSQVRQEMAQDTTMSEEDKQAYLQQVENEVQKIKDLDPNDASSVILGVEAVYWNSLNAVDAASVVRELSIPMLILQGEEDFQISVEQDYQLWQDTLAGRENVTFRLYPGLSHLFTKAGSKNRIDASVYDAPVKMDGQVIADIAEWIGSVQ